MKIVNAFLMCISTFTAIPCRIRKWDEEARPLMILMLPFAGLLLGALWLAVFWLIDRFALPFVLGAAIKTIFMYVASGFIHLDGYMDVADAIGSYKSVEERRNILKDSHCGSFAVIAAIILFLLEFSAFASSLAYEERMILFIPFVSRAMSGLFVSMLKPMPTSQYSGDFQSNIKKTYIAVFVIYILAAFAIALFWLGLFARVIIIEVLAHALATAYAYRQLEGMNGDISGFAICIAELAAVIAMVMI